MSRSKLKQAAKTLPAKAPAALESFLRDFFSRVPGDDLETLDPVLMADTAEIHWELSRGRKTGEPAINIRTAVLDHKNPGIGHTIIDLVNDDMAFLVDSVAAEIGRHRRLISMLLHPILHATIDGKGHAGKIAADAGKNTRAQSHMHIHIEGALPKSSIAELERGLRAVLRDVRFATRDWQQMRSRLTEAQESLRAAPRRYKREEIGEYADFIDYLYRDNFTLLGYREYKFTEKNGKIASQTVKESSLGLLHDDVKPAFIGAKDGLSQAMQAMRRSLPPLTVAKVNRRSTVHRPVPLDAVAVKRFDRDGKVTGEYLFIGLFTSVTYSRSIQDIPLLRGKAERIMARSGFRPGGHNYKALRHILEKYPRDELFQIADADLLKTALSILRLQERQRIALYMRPDPFGRYISCLVYVPRDRYDTRLRRAVRAILEEELGGACDDYQVNLDDSVFARVIYTVNIDQKNPPRYNADIIEARLQEAGRVWSEKLGRALQETGRREQDIPEIVEKYGQAFPTAYTERYLPKQAVYDLDKVEEALGKGELALDLYRDKECGPGQVRLKIYSPATPVILSDILPVLENMGLHVISELPFEIAPAGAGGSVWIQDFFMESSAAISPAQIAARKPVFEEALSRIWYMEMENDSLNHLVLNAGMDWRDIMILRTYVHYMRQARSPFSTRFIERALYNNAAIAGHAVGLFKALHDPKCRKDSARHAATCAAAIERGLEKVASLDEDRIIRSLAGMINATLRTNFFQPDRDGNLKPYMAIKLASRSVEDLPEPRPYREIFVYSTRVEGIHLRADVIARGGLRWSDRFEDFRTEVLGLMKAQQVKNSLIVPMGAKGGFVVKNPPREGGREAYLKEGVECYKLFVRNLLELTDNRRGGKVIPPPHVMRRDGDDPYLVVAADKGTATFSDIANGLSAEFGFWLGDAFASGGSAGYDHKKMGITARGAWESVKRHFRETGHDTQKKPFDVVGVGDMGGDVFGNGMLQSPHIRLVGAFNHIHIFCDPDPDTKAAFAERKRLFDAVKGWDDYNKKLLSRGGRIYNRSEKSLQLTPEIMKRFDITKEKVTPADLIQAMLRARADLLFFGGIGTYVKAAKETHADVGDKGNDSLRVSAGELRAKVIGEGANLAMTQAARIEFAEKGGRLNADFIDNSGGVNSSDLEVNIKILLNEIMSGKSPDLTPQKRNTLLAGMTNEVAQLVLRNSYQQTQGISLMELRAPENLSFHAAFIDDLERNHGLPRQIEGLPDAETVAARMRGGKGLARPELCILQAHAKILFAKDILASDIPDLPEMQDYWLFGYFPTPLQKKYRKDILNHRLRREIIATTLSTDLVNRMGPTFVKEVMDKTGSTSADVARSFLIAREAFGLRSLWEQIEALDGAVSAEVQMKAMRDIARMTERETIWFLTRLGRRMDVSRDIVTFSQGIADLREVVDDVVTDELRETIAQRTQANEANGLPRELAREIALIRPLGAACDIIRIGQDSRADLALTARIYYELGDHFHMHWLRQQARFMPADSRWTAEALDGLIQTLYLAQAGLAVRILKEMKPRAAGKKNGIVGKWVAQYAPQAAQFEAFLSDMRRAGTLDMAMLMAASQRLQQIHGG